VEDRGNAPRRQSPCKGNPLTLEHPPKFVKPEFLPATLKINPHLSEESLNPPQADLVARLRLELSRDVL
jgi:hypothetical protein